MSVSGTSYIDISTVVSPFHNDNRFYVQNVIPIRSFLEKLPASETPLALFVRSSEPHALKLGSTLSMGQ